MKSVLFLTTLILFAAPFSLFAQGLGAERSLHLQVLKDLKKDIEQNYYDPKFHGIDLDATIKTASGYVDAAKSLGEMDDAVARVLIQFDDSHLFYIPPPRTITVDYGWRIQMIGDKAFFTYVAPGSDAEKKGIRPGDQLYMLDGFIPERNQFWLLTYHYEVLAPQPKLTVIIVKPNGGKYKIEVEAKLEKESVFKPETRDLRLKFEKEFTERSRQSFYDAVPGVSIWKIPSFEFSDIKVDKMMNRVAKAPAVIIDLRGNGGGLLDSLVDLVVAFFDKDVKLGKLQYRKKTESAYMKGSGKGAYTGKLVVLVDSESSSAAEIFARIVQIEKRGFVIGDQTSGAVMVSNILPHYQGLDTQIGYAFSVTVADLIMMDGKSLEKVGVTPDEYVIPTAADLAAGRDPVLAEAVNYLGLKMTPEEAGKVFPVEK